MEVIYLKNDGRCKWLDKQVLNKLFPDMIANNKTQEDPQYLILDWMSSDNGKVGVDLKWLKKTGLSYIKSIDDLPEGNQFKIVNTGYDSIYDEELILKEKGVEMIDKPCPYVRRVRNAFEQADDNYQYILLCEANHIIIKNFAAIFPKDMILVQMNNYEERIEKQANGKPFILVSHVTFRTKNSQKIFDFIRTKFPEKDHKLIKTQCVWADSRVSPINEIEELPDSLVAEIDYACVIGTPGSVNKSSLSLIEAIEDRKIEIKYISSLKDFVSFKKQHDDCKVLLVRTPIPNEVEKPVLIYLQKGYAAALKSLITSRIFGKN